MWLVRRAEARALCNGMLPRGLRSGVRGRDETDEDDRNVEALAVEIKDLDKDDPDLHAISLLAGNLGITNGEIWAWVEPTPGFTAEVKNTTFRIASHRQRQMLMHKTGGVLEQRKSDRESARK
ncbi:hypothetical protein ACFX2J_045979 [Malus domestica]|uniref:Uncharacterized protein n=1 Tax=Malus domestica TaxID=3750 RepID=A0A498J126_MALDO|nr:hypothetical protein DVH24_000565 [Malus domestica]